MNESGGFLSRWARLKQRSRVEAGTDASGRETSRETVPPAAGASVPDPATTAGSAGHRTEPGRIERADSPRHSVSEAELDGRGSETAETAFVERNTPASERPNGSVPAVQEVPAAADASPVRPGDDTRRAELPSLDRLTPQSDFRPFMQAGVDASTRNAALKRLFGDPHFNLMDGLDVYIEDYGKPDPIPPAMLARLLREHSMDFLDAATDVAEAPAAPAAARLASAGPHVATDSAQIEAPGVPADSNADANSASASNAGPGIAPDPLPGAPADTDPLIGPGPGTDPHLDAAPGVSARGPVAARAVPPTPPKESSE